MTFITKNLKRSMYINRLMNLGVSNHNGTPVHEMNDKQLIKLLTKVGKGYEI